MIERFQVELEWLKKVARELPKRAKAQRPDYALGKSEERLADSPGTMYRAPTDEENWVVEL